MSKFLEWAQAEANNIVQQHKAASPAVQTILAERLWILELVATKYKELEGNETGADPIGRVIAPGPQGIITG